nr:hypothetical protein [uncultured Nitrososphaera sp.]
MKNSTKVEAIAVGSAGALGLALLLKFRKAFGSGSNGGGEQTVNAPPDAGGRTLSLNVKPTTVAPGASVFVTVNYFDPQAVTRQGFAIQITANGQVVPAPNTDDNGNITLELAFPTTGTYAILAARMSAVVLATPAITVTVR